MKHFAVLALYAVALNVHSHSHVDSMILEVEPGFHAGEKGIFTKRDNLSKLFTDDSEFTRTIDFPTQIVRIKGDVKDWNVACDKLTAYVDEVFSFLGKSDFYYNTLTWCGTDPETELAVRFSINSYFDPLTDEAVEFLKAHLAEHNGEMFFGVPFKIESAKGLAVSFNLDAAFVENPNSNLLVLRHDNSSLYFETNYDMLKELVMDMFENLYSNDPQVVLPFLVRWLGPGADVIFRNALPKSNYILVQPERIFLMDEGPKVFTSPLRMYFASQCFLRYPNEKCM